MIEKLRTKSSTFKMSSFVTLRLLILTSPIYRVSNIHSNATNSEQISKTKISQLDFSHLCSVLFLAHTRYKWLPHSHLHRLYFRLSLHLPLPHPNQLRRFPSRFRGRSLAVSELKTKEITPLMLFTKDNTKRIKDLA